MKKALLAFIFLLILASIALSQDVRKLNNLNQVDSLKSSYSGEVLLVNFWASWCKPCVEEFPDLVKLRNNYNGKGLKIVFISLDFPEDVNSKLIPFLKKNNVDFTTFYGDFKNTEELMDYFDKKWDGAIPATFIFDRKGALRSKIIGSRDYDFYNSEISKFTD